MSTGSDSMLEMRFTTVGVTKARGRIGNHIWLYMVHIAYELNYGFKMVVSEDTRFIMDQYFKGFDKYENKYAEKDLCGYEKFYAAFEDYLDHKIVEFYEKKSGIRVPINKPTDKEYMKNRSCSSPNMTPIMPHTIIHGSQRCIHYNIMERRTG